MPITSSIPQKLSLCDSLSSHLQSISGNFDISVVEIALARQGLDLKWFDTRQGFPLSLLAFSLPPLD
jgi:hypothetical protein